MTEHPPWMLKPTDRFILKWIKVNLSARVTPHLAGRPGIHPWMVTLTSAGLGVLAGPAFGLGCAGLAGILAALAQVLDGVDGQLARMTGRQSRAGAFMDSVVDRYADGALVIGMTVYLIRLPRGLPDAVLILLGALAVIGSNLISYSTARADSLGLDLGPPTLASKGTRTAVTIVFALGGAFWPPLPLAALAYLAVHPNIEVARRLGRTHRKRHHE